MQHERILLGFVAFTPRLSSAISDGGDMLSSMKTSEVSDLIKKPIAIINSATLKVCGPDMITAINDGVGNSDLQSYLQ
jgi:hypothetical protein